MSTSGSSGSSRGRLPNTEALLATTPGSSSSSSSSSRRSVQSLSTGSLSSTGTSTSSTGSVLPNTMKLLRVPATLVSPRPRSPGSPRRSRSPGSPRRRSLRARSSGSPRRSSSPGSPQSPSWYRSLRRRYLRHRPPRSPRSPSSSSGWSSAPPVFRRLKFTIKKKGDERATVVRVPRIAPPPAGLLRRRHTYRRPASVESSPFSPASSPKGPFRWSSSSESSSSPPTPPPKRGKALEAELLAYLRERHGARGARGAKGARDAKGAKGR